MVACETKPLNAMLVFTVTRLTIRSCTMKPGTPGIPEVLPFHDLHGLLVVNSHTPKRGGKGGLGMYEACSHHMHGHGKEDVHVATCIAQVFPLSFSTT